MQSTLPLQLQDHDDDARRIFFPLLDSPVQTAANAAVVHGDSYPPPPPNGVAESDQNRRRFNKYVLAGAILASTNSILLGYG